MQLLHYCFILSHGQPARKSIQELCLARCTVTTGAARYQTLMLVPLSDVQERATCGQRTWRGIVATLRRGLPRRMCVHVQQRCGTAPRCPVNQMMLPGWLGGMGFDGINGRSGGTEGRAAEADLHAHVAECEVRTYFKRYSLPGWSICFQMPGREPCKVIIGTLRRTLEADV